LIIIFAKTPPKEEIFSIMIAKQRGNTTEFVYERLIEELQRGDFLPGDKLTTDGLAKRYDVSRTPVREALVRLERDGILETDLNTGFRVRTLSLRELCDLYELREVLEGLAAARLAQHGATPEVLAALRECCEQRRNAASEDEMRAADHRFHTVIYDNCGSKQLQKLMHTYLILSTVFNSTTMMLRGRRYSNPRDINCEHDAIITAIEKGDAPLARKLLATHIAWARKRLEKLIE
jgi:DNA-binding GntR family transcriptional regulator